MPAQFAKPIMLLMKSAETLLKQSWQRVLSYPMPKDAHCILTSLFVLSEDRNLIDQAYEYIAKAIREAYPKHEIHSLLPYSNRRFIIEWESDDKRTKEEVLKIMARALQFCNGQAVVEFGG